MVPAVSVVIPSFNRARTLGEAIESALSSGIAEVIVVDDGSTDETQDVILGFESKVVAIFQENRGVSAARNVGIDHAKAPFLKFLDSDDRLVPGSLEQQLEDVTLLPDRCAPVGKLLVESRPSLGSAYESNREKSGGFRLIELMELSTEALQVSQPLLPTVAVRSVGGFRRSSLAEDYDLFLRLYMAGVRFYQTDTPVTHFSDIPSSERLSAAGLAGRFAEAREMYAALVSEALNWQSEEADVLRLGLARNLWSLGRRMARDDFRVEAKECFSLARELSGKKAHKAGLLLRILYCFMDPVLVERVAIAAKRIV